MISVSFFIKNSKKDKLGKVPINLKIYRSESDKVTIYTKIRVNPECWDGFSVLQGDMFHTSYNAMLSAMKSNILLMCANNPDESTAQIKQLYHNSFKIKYSIGQLLKEYFEARLNDVEMTNHDTRRTYRTHQKALDCYLRLTQLYHHPADQFAYQQASIIYQRVLKDNKSVIYSNKLMRKLKAAIQWGIGMRMIDSNMIQGFKLKSIAKKRMTSQDFLNLEEVVKLISVEVPAKYNKAKALATLQTFTGMSYVDVSNFNPESIKTIHNNKNIIANRSKIKEEFIVPLNLVAIGVLEGYNWLSLKKISNSTYNEQLKVLAAYAGITKNVTTHMLRRTFAQNMLEGGIKMEIVAKMLGHVDTRMLKFYTLVTDSMVNIEYSGKMAA